MALLIAMAQGIGWNICNLLRTEIRQCVRFPGYETWPVCLPILSLKLSDSILRKRCLILLVAAMRFRLIICIRLLVIILVVVVGLCCGTLSRWVPLLLALIGSSLKGNLSFVSLRTVRRMSLLLLVIMIVLGVVVLFVVNRLVVVCILVCRLSVS